MPKLRANHHQATFYEKLSFKKAWWLRTPIGPTGAAAGQWIKYQNRVELNGWSSSTNLETDMAPLGDGRHEATGHRQGSARRWKTMTFLAALRHDWIDAPWFIGGDRWRQLPVYVEKFFLPTLRPGDIVIMDNLGPQKQSRASAHPLGAAKLFLLPNTHLPQPHRTGLRQAQALAAKAPRAPVDAVCLAIGEFIKLSPPTNAPAMANSGYRRT